MIRAVVLISIYNAIDLVFIVGSGGGRNGGDRSAGGRCKLHNISW